MRWSSRTSTNACCWVRTRWRQRATYVAHGCYFDQMGEERIGIRELRQHASRYVRLAQAGHRIAVTDRGKLVAYLVPAEEPSSPLARLEAAGQVRRATGSILDVVPLPVAPAERPLSEILQQLRDEEAW